jgi:hypothetical protein
MTPVLILVTLGGVLLLLSAFVWLLYRLGGFHLTTRERRTWVIIGAALLVWVVILAFVGPLPPSVSLLLSAGVIGFAVWAWRSGRFRLERVPPDSREEVARRREWMRTHPGLLIGLGSAFTVLMVVWALAVVLVTRSG